MFLFCLCPVNSDFLYLRDGFVLLTNPVCFELVIVDDAVAEVQEEFRVYLLTISSGYIFRSVFATVVVRDNDGVLLMGGGCEV